MRSSARLLLCCLGPVLLHSAVVSGVVVGEDGNPVAGATVTAVRISTVPWTAASVSSGRDGAYSFPALATGRYQFCIQTPAGGYLDPCVWELMLPSIDVQKDVKGLDQRVRLGSILEVQINDAQNALSSKAAANKPQPNVMLGAFSHSGTFVPAALRTMSGNTRTHTLTIPYDTPIRVLASGKGVQLARADGARMDSTNDVVVVQHPRGGPKPSVLVITVTGATP